MIIRYGQFGANIQGHRAADKQHGQAEQQIQRANVLVIGRRDPAHAPGDEALALVPVLRMRVSYRATH
jgi:hypothetical protein